MSPAAEAVPALLAGLPRPVLLFGFGVEARGTLRFLRRHGVGALAAYDRAWRDGGPEAGAGGDADVVPELAGVRCFGGEDWPAAVDGAGTVVRSPGVRPDHPALERARAGGAVVTTATRLFLAACPGPVAGVTGTLGKGTTVSLIEAALRGGGAACRAGGNIGLNPLAFLDEMAPGEAAVLELSSFQLMDLEGRRPDVAVVLRTTAEHQDWHRDVGEYRAAKARLLAPPGEPQRVVYCADSAGSREIAGPRLDDALAVSRTGPVHEGVGVDAGRVCRFRAGRPEPWAELERLALPGGFNLENAAAAALAAEALGAGGADTRRAVAAFTGLPHRLERVGTVRGVTCYNDSYATRPEATEGAVASFDAPLAVILGGSEKHADFAPLGEALAAHRSLVRVVLIGATAGRLAGAVEAGARRVGRPAPSLVRADTLEAAFAAALEGLPEGAVLLFSPACASFDMFPNYKVRGERFRALVKSPPL